MAVVRAVVIIPAWPPPKVELHQVLAALGEGLTLQADLPATASQHLNEVHLTFMVEGPPSPELRAAAASAAQAAVASVHPGRTTVQVVLSPDARLDAIDLQTSTQVAPTRPA